MVIELAVITIGSFLAAVVNAMFATGGIHLLLASTTAVLPVAIAIPLQSVLAMSSLAARVWLFRTHIHWPLIFAFVPMAAVGAYFGALSFVAMDEDLLAILLGALLLLMIWVPIRHFVLPLRRPFAIIGLIHGYLGTVFGIGVVLQPAVLRTQLMKLQITGTLAVCLLMLDFFKITGYVLTGFDYRDYWVHILLATIGGTAGSFVGRNLTSRVSEAQFRLVFKWLITVVALRLLAIGLL